MTSEVTSVEAILLVLCQLWKNGFACRENFENYHPGKLFKISEICKGNISWGVPLQLNHFLRLTIVLLMILKLMMILWNFIMKLYLTSWSLLNLNCTDWIAISVLPNFLYSSCLNNFSDIFHYFGEDKIPKFKWLNHCVKLD